MNTISREELKQQCDSCCSKPTIVEVLSAENYQKSHLPGAINVPLDEDFDQHIQEQVPQKTDPVVVYCGSTQCRASEEAARHMEKLGYEHIYDYEGGKADWTAGGLPVES